MITIKKENNNNERTLTIDGFVIHQSLHNNVVSSALLGVVKKDSKHLGHDNITWAITTDIKCNDCRLCTGCVSTCHDCQGCTTCRGGCTSSCNACTGCQGNCANKCQGGTSGSGGCGGCDVCTGTCYTSGVSYQYCYCVGPCWNCANQGCRTQCLEGNQDDKYETKYKCQSGY